MNTVEVGRKGEELAKKYLKKLGYEIIDKNYKCKFGEIDLIAKEEDTLIFIEVKLRKNDKFGRPFESISNIKKKRLYYTALSYLKTKNLLNKNKSYRFDVVSISDKEISLFKNAFYVSEGL